MFNSLAHATKALRAHLPASQAERIAASLVPAVVFEPMTSGPVVTGTTRFGGTPDLPAGTQWPRPPAPPDAEEIAQRGNEEAANHMRRHLAEGLPYTFMAQIDLAAVATLGSVASTLPQDGRLLFFYDLTVGPWEMGTRPAHVIWDRSPPEGLAPLVLPADLAAAATRERQEMDKILAEYGATRQAASEDGTNYGAPARAMQPRLGLMLADLDVIDQAALHDQDDGHTQADRSEQAEALQAAYDEVLAENDFDPTRPWRRHQLLGRPRPEQDDPRFDAVVASEFRQQHLPQEEWMRHRDRIMAQARDWQLLLQIGLVDWMQADMVEGTVYFPVRRSDLAEQRFEQVVAVYQQT